MQRRAQWWLVITSPSGETKLPEHPCPSRTEESRTWSSHDWSGSNPYDFCTAALGKFSKVLIPSSAWATVVASSSARQLERVISEWVLFGVRCERTYWRGRSHKRDRSVPSNARLRAGRPSDRSPSTRPEHKDP